MKTLQNTETIFGEIESERIKQDLKWGEQNHDPVMWIAILGEEFGETAKEAHEAWFKEDDTERMEKLRHYREELIQVAAVAVAMIQSLDRNELA